MSNSLGFLAVAENTSTSAGPVMPPNGTNSTSISVASAFPALAPAVDPLTTTGTIRAAPPSPMPSFLSGENNSVFLAVMAVVLSEAA